MYHRKSRKKEIARRVFVYATMTATMMTLLIILTLTVLGYRYNFKTQQVEQASLVQYNSFPRGATVSIDGKQFGTTPSKSMVLPGQHRFSMSLAGYHDWHKTVSVEAGDVTWLSYVRLVPIEKRVQGIEEFDNLTSSRASTNGRFLAATTTNGNGLMELIMIDLRSSSRPKISRHSIDRKVDVQGVALAGQVLEVDSWSDDGRYILLKRSHKLGEANSFEWLWIDRDSPSKVFNLSELLNLPIKDVKMTDSRSVYVLQSSGDVRRLEVESGNISRPLLSQVDRFSVFDGEDIAYISKTRSGQLAGLWKRGWRQPVVLVSQDSKDNPPMRVAIGKYSGKDTAVISYGKLITIYHGALPSSDGEKRPVLPLAEVVASRSVTNVQISEDGRFIIAEDESGFISYDLERKTVSREIKKYNKSNIRWLDKHHLWQVDDTGQLVMQEFDGVNSHQILPADPAHDAVLTDDGKYIYSFSSSDRGLTLQRLSMTVD